MKNGKIKIPELLVVLVLLLNTNFLYLVENISDDIKLIVVLLFIIYCYLITANVEKKQSNLLGKIILFIPILIIASAIASYNSYGQDIWLGIRPQRTQLIWWFSYYGIYRLIIYNKITKKNIEKIIYYVGILEILTYSVFWILKGNIPFIHIPYDYRYSNIRLRADTMIILIWFIIATNKVLIGEKTKKNIIYVLIILIFEVCCVQTRLIMVAMSISMLLIFILWKKSIAIKICCIPVFIIACLAFLQTNMGKDLWRNLILNDTDANVEVRESGKEFYLEELKKSPIIGRGYVNTQYEVANQKAGINDGYYVVDNGIIGYLWYYGILGGIWILCVFIKILKLSIHNYTNRKEYTGIILCVMILILLPNIVCWWWNESFIFGMMMLISCMEKDNLERKREENEKYKYYRSI